MENLSGSTTTRPARRRDEIRRVLQANQLLWPTLLTPLISGPQLLLFSKILHITFTLFQSLLFHQYLDLLASSFLILQNLCLIPIGLSTSLIRLCPILPTLIHLRSILPTLIRSILLIMPREQATKVASSSVRQGGKKQSGVVRASSNETRVASDTRQKRKRKEPELLELPGNKNVWVQADSEVSEL